MSENGDLTDCIIDTALEIGFDRAAVSGVDSLPAAGRLRQWLADGMHGSMSWMARSAPRRLNPGKVVEGARSIVMVATDYTPEQPPTLDPERARISCYAWGGEYHHILGDRLEILLGKIRGFSPGTTGRWYVDTGPVMEKAWAEYAGLGWIGKHTNLIDAEVGSWFFLGALIIDLELRSGKPQEDRCGDCSLCIDVCPTGAIVAPYVLDARLCISYQTIENRGAIPRELRSNIGNHVFGCDDCQEVCPWNQHARAGKLARQFAPKARNERPSLLELWSLTETEFDKRFEFSPIKRTKYSGFRRNVAVALGNSGSRSAVGPLAMALDDPDPLVRGHVVWALGRLGTSGGRRALLAAADDELDPYVVEEIEAAMRQED